VTYIKVVSIPEQAFEIFLRDCANSPRGVVKRAEERRNAGERRYNAAHPQSTNKQPGRPQ